MLAGVDEERGRKGKGGWGQDEGCVCAMFFCGGGTNVSWAQRLVVLMEGRGKKKAGRWDGCEIFMSHGRGLCAHWLIWITHLAGLGDPATAPAASPSTAATVRTIKKWRLGPGESSPLRGGGPRLKEQGFEVA